MGGREGEFREKKCKCHKCHLKMNLCKKFHLLNRTMGECSKIGGIVLGKEENLGDEGIFFF